MNFCIASQTVAAGNVDVVVFVDDDDNDDDVPAATHSDFKYKCAERIYVPTLSQCDRFHF